MRAQTKYNQLKDLIYKKTDTSLIHPDGRIIMDEWERPIMERVTEWVCSNGGDILELGFGMGISAELIQLHNIKSHTICEINDNLFEDLEEWSKNKKNVKCIKGDWFDNIHNLKVYDGIFFDTYDDDITPFLEIIPQISKPGTKLYMFFWGSQKEPINYFQDVTVEVIDITPTKNDYFNSDKFYIHLITI